MSEMKRAGQVWKEFEDYLAPVLGLKPGERAVYMHALRHSRLEGKRAVVFTTRVLAQGVGLKPSSARLHLFTLARKGCVRVKRYRGRTLVEVLLPEEAIRELRPRTWPALERRPMRVSKHRKSREAILRREGGRCFYCRKELVPGQMSFDHLVALSRGGAPEMSNVVACCPGCNQQKGVGSARQFLSRLLRRRLLSPAQYNQRLAALNRILRGKRFGPV